MVAAEGMQPARLVWRADVTADRVSRRDVTMIFCCQKVGQYYSASPFCYSSPEDDGLVLLGINSTSYLNVSKLV